MAKKNTPKVKKPEPKRAPEKFVVRDDLENFIAVPIEQLVKADWNYKEEDEFMMSQLVNNIGENGQIENIIVRELGPKKYEVVNGNHRYDACMTLKKTKVIAYNLGKISLDRAKKIAVVTNETRFKSDPVKFAELMTHLQNNLNYDDLAREMPFKPDELVNFTKLTKFDWEHPAQPTSSVTTEEEEESDGFVTVKLKLPETLANEFTLQVERFKRAIAPGETDVSHVNVTEAIEALVKRIATLKDSDLI